jgi:antitoxin StbD
MMQKILATKTASLTDLRDPMKVIESLGDGRIAILNRNKVVAYIVPPSHIENSDIQYMDPGDVTRIVSDLKNTHSHVLEYLRDK